MAWSIEFASEQVAKKVTEAYQNDAIRAAATKMAGADARSIRAALALEAARQYFADLERF